MKESKSYSLRPTLILTRSYNARQNERFSLELPGLISKVLSVQILSAMLFVVAHELFLAPNLSANNV